MRKPLLATGKLGGDYELIFAYWDEAGGKGSDKASQIVLKREDFDKALEIITGKKRARASDLVKELSEMFKDRIDPEIAVKAYFKVHSRIIESEEAVERLAEALASWLLEAIESQGKIVFKKA